MNNDLTRKLVKLADILDRQGNKDLANQIDEMLLYYARKTPWQDKIKCAIDESGEEEIEIEIPAEEKEILNDVLYSLQRSLE